jgi:hypothetical protein
MTHPTKKGRKLFQQFRPGKNKASQDHHTGFTAG